jgi:hypothetical protein
MKKHILAACSIAVISGAGLAAQQPQPITPPTQQTPPSQPAQRPPDPTPSPTSQPPATRPAAPASDMARTATTVTGCLKTWDSRTMAPATGSGSGAGSAASAVTAAPGGSAQYVLSNIERTGASSRSGASSFLLKTSDSGVSFSQHVNHKVEVTGTLSDAAPVASTDKPMADKPSEARDASASGRVSTSDMKLPTLNVTALKMVSPTCGTGSN